MSLFDNMHTRPGKLKYEGSKLSELQANPGNSLLVDLIVGKLKASQSPKNPDPEATKYHVMDAQGTRDAILNFLTKYCSYLVFNSPFYCNFFQLF